MALIINHANFVAYRFGAGSMLPRDYSEGITAFGAPVVSLEKTMAAQVVLELKLVMVMGV